MLKHKRGWNGMNTAVCGAVTKEFAHLKNVTCEACIEKIKEEKLRERGAKIAATRANRDESLHTIVLKLLETNVSFSYDAATKQIIVNIRG